jgi:aspartate kinase
MHCLFISWIHFAAYLEELEQLLKGIAMMKELTLRTRDYLVSFGECLSTRIFAAYLNTIGVKARQYDAFEIGFITTDDFTNGDILEATYPAVAKRLYDDWMHDPAVPIVTGFLGKGWKTGAVTTLGRGGSDLTATTIGKALGLKEIQVLLQSQSVMFSLQTLHTFCSVWMFVFPLSRCGKMSMVF